MLIEHSEIRLSREADGQDHLYVEPREERVVKVPKE